MSSATMKHSGNVGDLIYGLPTIKALGGADLRLELNHPARYPSADFHPCGSARMDARMANMAKPLLESQPYISGLSIWNGEAVDIDLDKFREKGKPCDHLAERHAMLFPEVSVDLSEPWLTVGPNTDYADAIVVNRTFRYRGDAAKGWTALRETSRRVVFLGLPDEFADFLNLVPSAEHVQTADFLESARIIAGCQAFIGNQSSCWAIAEGLKVRRVLEVLNRCPNCMPRGANGTACMNADEMAGAVREASA